MPAPQDEIEQIDALARWGKIGARLAKGRAATGLTKREAANRAGFSEALWRHLEAGRKEVYGKIVLPNPRRENLVAAATAVGIDPEEILAMLGVTPAPAETPVSSASGVTALSARIDRLSVRDRSIVEALVTALETPAPAATGARTAVSVVADPTPVPDASEGDTAILEPSPQPEAVDEAAVTVGAESRPLAPMTGPPPAPFLLLPPVASPTAPRPLPPPLPVPLR